LTIKAVTFDFWSTLYKTVTSNHVQRLRGLKAAFEQSSGATFEFDQFKAAVIATRNTWRQIWMEELRTIDAGEWLDVLQAKLEVTVDPADLAEIQTRMEQAILEDSPTLVPEAKAVLANLADHYRLAIISDTGITPGRVLRQLLARDKIIDYFSRLTFSDEVGRSKPHPDAFLTTLSALAVKPSQAVHVGDLLRTDVAGAQAVGMRAIQYTGVIQDDWIAVSDEPARTVVPDAIIKDHTELKSLLRQWNGKIYFPQTRQQGQKE
jgi:HAD superfamily hydrolase (TIGR01549 family)